jgi:hypothetical protein
MHEIGHAFGLGHVESSSSIFLLEPFTNTAINGPQLDDIRGIQHLYGDVNEKGAGNNSVVTATPLGTVTQGTSVLRGEHASTGTFVLMDEADFLSISNANDADYFSFEITTPSLLDLVVTPLGPNYNERVNPGDSYTTTMSASLSDLNLELFKNGSAVPIAAGGGNPIGQPEAILGFPLLESGEYIFRVSGNSALTQMYQFSLAVEGLSLAQPGDIDEDGDVDGFDFLKWQRGESPIPHSTSDLSDWQANYGTLDALASSRSVPEPPTKVLLVAAIVAIPGRRRLDFATELRKILTSQT